MTRERLVIYGASDFAHVVTEVVQLSTNFEISGYLDDNTSRQGHNFLGAKILGGLKDLPRLRREGITHAVLGFGDCEGRLKVGSALAEAGIRCVTLIHPAATVSKNASLGDGTLVLAGAVVDPNVHIGANSLLNKNCVVGHNSRVGSAVHLASGACLGGHCHIGDATLIGMGANILSNLHVGGHSIVGAGSVVTKDLPVNTVSWGVPARVQQTHTVY